MRLRSPKNIFDYLSLILVVAGIVAGCMAIHAQRTNAFKGTWLGLFFVCFGLACAAFTTSIVVKGEYGSGWTTCTRSTSPYEFWLSVIARCAACLLLLACGALFLLGLAY